MAADIRDLMVRLGSEGIAVHLAAEHPAGGLDPRPEAVAHAAGLTDRRDLLQMRRSLPVEPDHPQRLSAPAIRTRPFVPGVDDAAWIRVNNRAFADHPDQGREDQATLTTRMAEPWFDAAGFLVSDEEGEVEARSASGRDGSGNASELSGFCWTKVHPEVADVEPALGEIYVIGVDPRHRGEGLGPAFVLAGLDHLSAQGIGTAVLYVDADNEPARRLYDRLGFSVHRRRRVYTAPGSGESR